jgi:hypothetical protein
MIDSLRALLARTRGNLNVFCWIETELREKLGMRGCVKHSVGHRLRHLPLFALGYSILARIVPGMWVE